MKRKKQVNWKFEKKFCPQSEECIIGEVSTANGDPHEDYLFRPDIGRILNITRRNSNRTGRNSNRTDRISDITGRISNITGRIPDILGRSQIKLKLNLSYLNLLAIPYGRSTWHSFSR